MASRQQRQDLIRKIVRDHSVGSQRELVEALLQLGVRVAQATVSRDIHALGLIKVADDEGSHYALPERALPAAGVSSATYRSARAELERTFERSVRAIGQPNAMLTLHTPSGLANAVAVALDQVAFEEIVATVAGDDTVLVLVRDERSRKKMAKTLGRLSSNLSE